MTRVQRLLQINPILVKEIRSRMRGPRAFLTITAILLSMAGLMYAVLQLILAAARYTNILSPQVGQTMFAALAFLELVMICAITPAVTASAISSEKEKQTYEMLMATPLSPTRILWGKLVSSLSYVLLLLFAGIPLASIVFIFGGVAPRDMLKALVVLIGIAIAYGILGLFLSALFGRSGRATVASFLIVAALVIGPIFAAGLVAAMTNTEPPRWILAPSPISALSSALAPSVGINTGGNLFYLLSGIFSMGNSPISMTSIPRPMYHYTLFFYLGLSSVLYLLTTRLVQPTRRWRMTRAELFSGVGFLILVFGLIAGAYFGTTRHYERAVPPQQAPDGMSTEAPMFGPVQAEPAQKVVPVMPLEGTPTPPPTAGPTQTPLGQISPSTPVDDAHSAAIYAAVVRLIYTDDHTFGDKAPNWPVIYLVATINDSLGDSQAKPVWLSEDLRAQISQAIADLPTQPVWVLTRAQVSTDAETGAVDGGKGAIFTLGDILLLPDGGVHVSANITYGNNVAAGSTYNLTKQEGTWRISEKTGMQWIS